MLPNPVAFGELEEEGDEEVEVLGYEGRDSIEVVRR